MEKAHDAGVQAIAWKDGKLITAGKDKKINEIFFLKEKKNVVIASTDSIPKAIDLYANNLVVGEEDGTITYLAENKGAFKEWKCHSNGVLMGLDVRGDDVITLDDDNKIIMWDCKTSKLKASSQIQPSADKPTPDKKANIPKVLCCNQKKQEIAVSINSGEVQILGADLKTTKKFGKIEDGPIEAMVYSLDGQKLAIGAKNKTYVCDANDYSLLYEVKDITGVVAIDWSGKGEYIRFQVGKQKVLFYNVNDKNWTEKSAEETKDTIWESQNVKISWHVWGVYSQPNAFENFPGIAVCNMGNMNLLATGGTDGLVNIYNYPAPKQDNKLECISLR